jgi:hypothetical protein
MANDKYWNQFGGDYNEVNKNLGGLPEVVRKIQPPVQTVQPAQDTQTAGAPEKSFGAAGLLPYTTLPGVGAAGMLGGALAGSVLAPAAAAYGIGKLVASEWTDKTIGKIRDFITSKVSPLINKASAVGSAYETGMAESIPGSRFLESKLPAVQNYLAQIKAQHPLAATAGQVAGTAGMMALPGANIAKGAGIGATALNAAINAAPFALGTGLDVGATTGDVGQGLTAGLMGEALGTALPTAISGLAKIPFINRGLAKLQLAGAGMHSDPRLVLKARAKSLGMTGGQVDTYIAQHADELVNNAADLVTRFGPTRAGKDAIKDWNSSGFNAHDRLYEGVTGNKITAGDVAAVKADSDLDSVRGLFTDDQINQAVENVGQKIDGQGWTKARNNVLSPYMKAGNVFSQKGLAADDPRILQSVVAGAWHDRVDSVADHAMEWAKAGELGPDAQAAAKDVPALHILKATYPATLAITKAGAREAAGISSRFAPGSDTAVRALLGLSLGGGAAIQGIPDMLQNPENIPVDLVKIAGAGLAGRLLNRGAGRLLELGTGAGAGAMRAGAGGPPSAAIGRLAAQAGRVMNAPQEEPDTEAPEGQAPQGPGATPQTPNAPGISQADIEGLGGGPLTANQQAVLNMLPNAAVPPAQHAKDIAAATRKEQEIQPEQKAAANDMLAPAREKIKAKLLAEYQSWESPYKDDWDKYYKDALTYTDNFNPLNEYTAKIIGGKDYKDYLRSYNVALRLQTLGPDLAHAIAPSYLPGLLLSGVAKQKEARDELVNTLWTAMSGDLKSPSKADRAAIENKLNMLRREKFTPRGAKKKILDMLQQDYNVRLDLLNQYGLAPGLAQ